ncbi:dipeptide epimerase [Steroidobacter sp.]|uniref:dipeptide epimerase n=1 Tax=Steroidobacter sp. TaxID=1978227 RepID=UPI001A622D74|nr:dipeptide epimerase [Steroidobacter sp.]MBL8265261.1 dipeptide epimerase [Steroidobacter sp.]
MGPLQVHMEIERWPLRVPFRISGYTFTTIDVMVVSVEKDGMIGRGEAAGVYYRNETAAGLLEQIAPLRQQIEAGITRDSLQKLLPAGGARNALDCALWELESKLQRRPVWELAGLQEPRSLLTTFTCGAEDPSVMAATARSYSGARAIKLKLTGDPIDADRVRAVRECLPHVWLGVDANQGLTRATLEQLMPVLLDAGVSLIEQPLPVGQEAQLDGFRSPIPLAADESVQGLADLPGMVGRFDVINIKLDKCGGLTEGLEMARRARTLGLETMVGNMIGTSLAMAPAFLVGQLCSVVDLDGVALLGTDRPNGVSYADGYVSCSATTWGA